MRTYRINVSIVIAVILLYAGASVARAQKNPLWIGYQLTTNPDFQPSARDVEAQARTERQAALVICEKSGNQSECEQQAEITFRRHIADRNIMFRLYTGQQQNGSWSFAWLLNITPQDMVNPDFDQNFNHLAPDRISRLGLHVDVQNGCQFRRDNDDMVISYNHNLQQITCELIQGDENASGMLWRVLDQTSSSNEWIVSFLLDHGVSADLRISDAPAVLRALQRNHLEAAQILIEHGANVNATMEDDFAPDVGTTPLMWAAARGQTELVRLLLEHHADPNVERRAKREPEPGAMAKLAVARCRSCPDAIGFSWYNHPPPPEVMPWSTALASALANHHLDAATLLLDHGAIADQTVRYVGSGGIKQSWVAPALILFSDDLDTVKLLLEHGADVNGRDKDGDTALLLACGVSVFARPGPEIVRLLLAHHADVNAKDDLGTTPLMAAAKDGRTDVVRLLLDAHANVNAVDQKGISALQYAGYGQIVALLRARGAR